MIFLIFKGNELPTKIEDSIINETIVEYYDAFFNPFEGFTEEERATVRKRLLLEYKKNGTYQEIEEQVEKEYIKRIEEEEIISVPK